MRSLTTPQSPLNYPPQAAFEEQLLSWVHALRLTETTCKTFGNHISAIPLPHPQFLLFSTAGHTKIPLQQNNPLHLGVTMTTESRFAPTQTTKCAFHISSFGLLLQRRQNIQLDLLFCGPGTSHISCTVRTFALVCSVQSSPFTLL